MTLFGSRFSRSFIFAANGLENRIDSDGEAALIVIVSEVRLDLVFRDVKAGHVGQRTFQPVADLDKHLAVLNEHKKNDAIATPFLTNAPRLGYPLRVILD